MIVTAIFRSGATRFCLDWAKDNDVEYIGQIDRNSIRGFASLDKEKHHETHTQPPLSFSKIIDVLDTVIKDGLSYVVLNNTCNPALFKHTDIYITRKDLAASFHSLISLMQRQYPGITSASMDSVLAQHAYQIGLLHTYLQKHNLTPLYFEDLYPESKTRYASLSDPSFCYVVNKYMNALKNQGIK